LNELRAKHREELGASKNQVTRLTRVTQNLVHQNDLHLADAWIRKNEKAQAYYGEGDYNDFEEQSRPARRRRSLVSKANRIANTYHQQNKRQPSPNKLLDMAFAATPRKGKGKDKPPKNKTPTKAARPAGARTERQPRKTKLTEDQQLEEAGAKVTEWQRQHGIQV